MSYNSKLSSCSATLLIPKKIAQFAKLPPWVTRTHLQKIEIKISPCYFYTSKLMWYKAIELYIIPKIKTNEKLFIQFLSSFLFPIEKFKQISFPHHNIIRKVSKRPLFNYGPIKIGSQRTKDTLLSLHKVATHRPQADDLLVKPNRPAIAHLQQIMPIKIIAQVLTLS